MKGVIFLLAIITIIAIGFYDSFFSKELKIDSYLLNNQTQAEYKQCQACHKKEVTLWKKSHHKKAMQVANGETVLGNFNNQTFVKDEETTRFFKKDGKFFVNTSNKDGKKQDFLVKFVFGFEPLQQYLIETENKAIACLTIAWDNQKKQWYSLYPNTKISHKDRLHWTNQGQNWNSMCASCHTTNFQKNYDTEQNVYHSSFEQLTVSCSACHGDSSKHLAMAKSGDLAKLSRKDRWKHKYGFAQSIIRHPTNSQTEIDSCASCHSLRTELKTQAKSDELFADKYIVNLLERHLYHNDGQLKEETYVYGSFLQSKMYYKGVRCSDCHNPHSGKLVAQNNNLCIRCHQPYQFDTPKHTHHKKGSQGSLCINCHMPGKYYMGIDFRRDHSFRIPRPDLSAKYKTPNACNSCHTDKSATWSAQAIEKWFGEKRKPHFSDTLLPARKNNDSKLFIQLLQDKEQPAIIRATVANELVQFQRFPEVRQQLIQALKDESYLVRIAATRVLINSPSKVRLENIYPLLKDKLLAVRLSTYQTLLGIPEISRLPFDKKQIFLKVGKEFKNYLLHNSDSPSGQFQYGLYYSTIGDNQKAKKSYLKAIDLDRRFAIARFNLAALYRREKNIQQAKKQYEQVLKYEPKNYHANFQIALMYYSIKEYALAIKSFKLALAQQPQNHYLYYCLAELYLKTSRYNEAENFYKKALDTSPQNYTYLLALGKFYLYQRNLSKLDAIIRRLIFIAPRDPAVFQLRYEQKKLEANQKK